MTAATVTLRSTSLRAARAEAVLTWACAGGFGMGTAAMTFELFTPRRFFHA